MDDTDLLSIDSHPRLPVDVMDRVHKVIRAATAGGRAYLEVRTWISELQVATGDQGVSWVRDWPAQDMRIRHVQLLEWRYEGEEKIPVIHWETPSIDTDAV
ncbi:hypothetical protein [Roseomonas sp. WA12]